MNREPLSKIILLLLSSYIAFQTGQKILKQLIYYMSFSPNCYRIFDQILLSFHNQPYSYVTLNCVTWLLCIFLTWTLIKPNKEDTYIFITAVFLMSYQFAIRQAPQYLLLTLLVLVSPFFLLLLVLIKEYSVIVGILYLIIYRKEILGKRTILIIIVSSLIYLLIYIIIGNVPYFTEGAPLFSFQYMLSKLFVNIESILINCVFISFMLILVIQEKRDVFFLGLCAIFIFAFGLFWEIHLWFVSIVVIIGEKERKRMEKKRTFLNDKISKKDFEMVIMQELLK